MSGSERVTPLPHRLSSPSSGRRRIWNSVILPNDFFEVVCDSTRLTHVYTCSYWVAEFVSSKSGVELAEISSNSESGCELGFSDQLLKACDERKLWQITY